ncbi:hypothetical protein [Streptomyces sp. NBC_01264]|uniref:hypothetical protein n=1 Tax=Streptomyces sp. NBC_01264 TaxID=2903804 RepID=UPI00225B4A05|nr:hypothetical protein [Streptomyces sp. NBC_01264]MCX4775605.1 hypothetical protein [Streptomyces sp. NBC_01264]
MEGTEARTGSRTAGAVFVVIAASVVYGWAWWCLAGASAPSMTVAVAVGAVMLVAAWVGYLKLVGGSAGVFGAIFLVLGLLTLVALADRTAVRGAVADCVVSEVHEKTQSSSGEGGPPPRTVYRHVLSCPDGYPDELKDDRRLAPQGGRIQVAYDPGRRVSPQVRRSGTPWAPLLLALGLLGGSGALARRRPAPQEGPPGR